MALSKDDILNAIAAMTVMDVVDLIKAMEEKFGVSAAAAVAAAPAAAAAAAAPAEEEKTEFDVILKDSGSDRYLPIWIGACEADAITIELQGVEVARPFTHDLLKSVVSQLGGKIKSV